MRGAMGGIIYGHTSELQLKKIEKGRKREREYLIWQMIS